MAGDLGGWHRADTLHGAAQGFLDQVGQPWLVLYYENVRDGSVDAIRAALGDEEFQRAFASGRQLSFDDSFALALEATASVD